MSDGGFRKNTLDDVIQLSGAALDFQFFSHYIDEIALQLSICYAMIIVAIPSINIAANYTQKSFGMLLCF